MTLAFSTELNKKPTYFVEKILTSLVKEKLIEVMPFAKLALEYYNKFNLDHDKAPAVYPKIHTIRVDEHDRWKEGMLIHFVINNRTPNRYQFAPVLKCVSTQKIKIHYWYNAKNEAFDIPSVYLDGEEINETLINEIAINDGFDSTYGFFRYFNTDFSGKIIHWTNKKY